MDNQKKLILIVDDNKTMRLIMQQVLTTAGYETIVAEDGQQAIKLFSEHSPDCVLLDVNMPGMDGFETCAQIRQLAKGQYIPIMITTTLNDLNSISKAYRAGATDFEVKPINWDLIAHRVRYLIRTSVAHTEELEQANQELLVAITELKNTQAKLVESEKLASLGNLIQGITHEISTPINMAVTTMSNLRGKIDYLKAAFEHNRLKRSELHNFIKSSDESTNVLQVDLNRASGLVSSFVQISADYTADEPEKINLKLALEDVIASLQPEMKQYAVTIDLHCPDDLIIRTWLRPIFQLLTILFLNSLQHAFDIFDKGAISLNAYQEGEEVIVGFSDTGKGISKENIVRIFEPFFTTNRGEGSIGLGLHIAYNIVQSLRGSIKVSSELGQGTTFLIKLPVDVTNKQKVITNG